MENHSDKCSNCNSTKSVTFWDYPDGSMLCDKCEKKHSKEWEKEHSTKAQIYVEEKDLAISNTNKNELIRAVDKEVSKVYLFSKENILSVETYPQYYIWVLVGIMFVLLLLFGFILGLLGFVFAIYLARSILAKSIGEKKESELISLSSNELKNSNTIKSEIINWSDVSKAELKHNDFSTNGNLILYLKGSGKKLIVRNKRVEALNLLKSKLESKLIIKD